MEYGGCLVGYKLLYPSLSLDSLYDGQNHFWESIGIGVQRVERSMKSYRTI